MLPLRFVNVMKKTYPTISLASAWLKYSRRFFTESGSISS